MVSLHSIHPTESLRLLLRKPWQSAPMWCKVVRAISWVMYMTGRSHIRSDEKETRRTSVSLPSELHRQLEQIAKQKKVSLAWVIRDAAEVYVEDKSSLPVKKR